LTFEAHHEFALEYQIKNTLKINGLDGNSYISRHFPCAASGCKCRNRTAKRPIADVLTLEPFFEAYVTKSWN
jgi:hypothetical protein